MTVVHVAAEPCKLVLGPCLPPLLECICKCVFFFGEVVSFFVVSLECACLNNDIYEHAKSVGRRA